jgi:large subunit ribosomal protein L9
MKVILTQNVPKIGQKGMVKDLNEGYVRNFLLPRKLAKIATNDALRSLEEEQKKHKQKEETIQKTVKKILLDLNGATISISAKANDKGHLFAGLHVKEVADAIGDAGFKISEDWINLDEPIRQVGNHKINLEASGVKGKFNLEVKGM